MFKGSRAARGCSSLAGTAQISGYRSAMGRQAQQANRLYKLSVMKQSLLNKQRTFEQKLRELDTQLKIINADMKRIERQYSEESGGQTRLTEERLSRRGITPSRRRSGRMQLKY